MNTMTMALATLSVLCLFYLTGMAQASDAGKLNVDEKNLVDDISSKENVKRDAFWKRDQYSTFWKRPAATEDAFWKRGQYSNFWKRPADANEAFWKRDGAQLSPELEKIGEQIAANRLADIRQISHQRPISSKIRRTAYNPEFNPTGW